MFQTIKNNHIVRRYQKSNGLQKSIVAFCVFVTAMLLFRLLYTGKPMFLFLAWNVFLGYLPYLVSQRLLSASKLQKRSHFLLFFTAWILLLPNSFYIVTDLFHLKERPPIPLWYDLTVIFSSAWIGLVFGVLSIRDVEMKIARRFKLPSKAVLIVPVMFLISLGIYIGRYLRYNSWDVITDPFSLAADMIYLCIHPIRNRFDWSMIVCFTILFSLFYFSLKELIIERREKKSEAV